MKTIASFLISLLILTSVVAQTDSTSLPPFLFGAGEKLSLSGYLQTDDRVGIISPHDKLNWQEYRLSLSPSYRTARTRFSSEIWVRSLITPDIESYTNLSNKNIVAPVDVDLREAWFDIYDFLIPGLDLRLGRQRIAWGTADRLNPTDNLNPYDLEDIWDFGRHLSSNSIKLSWYFREWTITGVLIPGFAPSLAPSEEWMSVFTPDFNLPDEFTMGPASIRLKNTEMNESLKIHDKGFRESASYGFRVERPIGGFNTSVSYAYTRDVMPLPYDAIISPVNISPGFDTLYYSIDAKLKYPQMKIIGLDFAGSLRKVGVWGEAAIFFPEKVRLTSSMNFFGMNFNVLDSLVLDDKAYVKYVFGADYTFRNNIYINIQYLHGFLHEKGRGNLNDYIVFAGEWRTMRDKLKISPLNFCLQVNDFSDFIDTYSFVSLPEVSYKAADNAEIGIGARLIFGSDSGLFGKMKDRDHVFLRCRISF